MKTRRAFMRGILQALVGAAVPPVPVQVIPLWPNTVAWHSIAHASGLPVTARATGNIVVQWSDAGRILRL